MGRGLPFLLDLFVLALLIGVPVTQVVIPLWRGTKLFPFFRIARSNAERKLVELNERSDVADLEEIISRGQERFRRPRSGDPKPVPPSPPPVYQQPGSTVRNTRTPAKPTSRRTK